MKKEEAIYTVDEVGHEWPGILSLVSMGETVSIYDVDKGLVVAEIRPPRNKGISFNAMNKEKVSNAIIDDIEGQEFDVMDYDWEFE
jgi:hypothetical protein